MHTFTCHITAMLCIAYWELVSLSLRKSFMVHILHIHGHIHVNRESIIALLRGCALWNADDVTWYDCKAYDVRIRFTCNYAIHRKCTLHIVNCPTITKNQNVSKLQWLKYELFLLLLLKLLNRYCNGLYACTLHAVLYSPFFYTFSVTAR